jgi:hypothetical protein
VPFHGAIGDGNTVSPAASPQFPEAASAGVSIVEKSNNAVAAAANRLARSILTTFMEGPGTAFGPASRTGLQDSRTEGNQSANLTAILRL